MAQIMVKDLTFSYDSSYENIFEHVSFLIDTDWRIGFVGRNGRGKTTFLNLLMGRYEYQGSITASVDFDYFPFEVAEPDRITLEVIKDIIAPFREWELQMQQCLEQGADEAAMARYGELQELYQKQDGYIIEDLIEKELYKLQVDLSVLERPFSTLSFGERTKLMLAALFLKKNHFLLIDEPTNHLDMEGREILANYLQGKKGFLLVSHDRAFLDQCIDHVLAINRANIEIQKGNFSSWYQNRERQDQYELEKNEQLKKEIAELAEAARRTAGWSDQVEASKIGSHSFDRGAIGHKAAKMMKRAKAIENRKLASIEEKKGLLKNIEQAEPLKMNVLDFYKERLMEAEDLSLYYDGRKIAGPLSLQLNRGDRIAVRGRNGSGKSTLFKLLLGEGIEYTGRYQVASGLKISYVSQDTSGLTGNLKDYALYHGLDETIFKTVLRQLDFSRNQFDKNMEEFSAGQKKKVLLARSLTEPSHVFLWDEPLNFIDVLSRIQLEELLLKYRPTMIFVEHDRVFTEKIMTKELRLS
jgi:lincosamide and streptogramin A transport system ATP-binding/permease protein